MTDAYAAGLVDGEGTIYIDKNLAVRLEIQMAERALPTLESLRQGYGGKVKMCRPATEKWAASWRWTQWSEAAGETLERLLPYLQIKRPQAELALQLLNLKPKNKQIKWTSDQRATAAAMRGRMIELNRKGPDAEMPDPDADAFPGSTKIARLVDGRWVTDQTSLSSGQEFETFSEGFPTAGFMTAHGAYSTPSISECPSDGSVYSSLPDVLEADVPPRFFLSPKAAAGILRRAAERGRQLPPPLATALADLASQHREDDRRTTGTSSGCSTQREEERTTTPPRQGTLWEHSCEEIGSTTQKSGEVALSRLKSEPCEPEATTSDSIPRSATRSSARLSPERDTTGAKTEPGATPSSPQPSARTPEEGGAPTERPRRRTSLRRLLPVERERLQGFPDLWTIPYGPSLAPPRLDLTDPESDKWATPSRSQSPSGSGSG